MLQGRILAVWVEVRTPPFTLAGNADGKTERRVADQFKPIQFPFSKALIARVRLNPSIPILIFAVKNEKSLSQLPLEYWA